MNMEPMMTAMLEGEWSSLSGMYTTEEADFMAQLLNNCSVNPDDLHLGVGSTSWPGCHESTMDMATGFGEGSLNFSDNANANLYCFSQGSSYSDGSGSNSSTSFFPTLHHESCYYPSDSHRILAMDDDSMTMDFCLGNEKSTGLSVQTLKGDNVVEMDGCLINQEMTDDGSFEDQSHENLPGKNLPNENLQLINKESEKPLPDEATDCANINLSKNKKRSANSNFQKNKRNVKSRKCLKPVSSDNNGEDNKAGLNRQSSSSCISEDYSIDSHEFNGEITTSLSTKGLIAPTSNGKTRASRGSATDPQSLYARKRRERINERLRILQNIVPNGTKVDISTMLEEAVQYVNFLQLQIKLLSSDDLWMYAPLAYNGRDIGLDLKINALNDIGRLKSG